MVWFGPAGLDGGVGCLWKASGGEAWAPALAILTARRTRRRKPRACPPRAQGRIFFGKAQGRVEEEEEKEGEEEMEEEEGQRRKREGGGGGSHSSITHSISSMCSKYLKSRKSIPSSTNTFVCFLNSLCTSALAIPRR